MNRLEARTPTVTAVTEVVERPAALAGVLVEAGLLVEEPVDGLVVALVMVTTPHIPLWQCVATGQ